MAASACLASYGTTLRDLYAIEAALTDKMLKGAAPADTPAQQPTRFQLVINLKTANALGLTIPRSILARADEVSECAAIPMVTAWTAASTPLHSRPCVAGFASLPM